MSNWIVYLGWKRQKKNLPDQKLLSFLFGKVLFFLLLLLFVRDSDECLPRIGLLILCQAWIRLFLFSSNIFIINKKNNLKLFLLTNRANTVEKDRRSLSRLAFWSCRSYCLFFGYFCFSILFICLVCLCVGGGQILSLRSDELCQIG